MTDDPQFSFAGGSPDRFIVSLAADPARVRVLPRAVLARSDWDEAALAALDRIFVAAVRLAVQRHDERVRREVHASLTVVLNLLESRQPELAGRLRGALSILADMIAEQQDFPVEEVLSKKHVQAILNVAVAHGAVRKSVLMELLALKDANASRILCAMESAGLIEREVMGREILVKPRALGLKHASVRPRNPTRKQLAAELSEVHYMPKKQAELVVSDFIDRMGGHLKKGKKLRISGLGILQVRARPARKGRNPATVESIKIKASKKVAFRPSKDLKDSVS